MKKNHTFLRILILSLALVVFLALASCNSDGETAATGTTDDSTVTDPDTTATEPSTTEPATTEPATTEPATTEPATTEPGTTEPTTTEPTSTDPDATLDPIAGLAKLGEDAFVKELPAEYANAIVIQAGSMETGCTDIFENTKDNQYHLSTIPASTESSANGVIKLRCPAKESQTGYDSEIYHYYFNPGAEGCMAQNGGQKLSCDQMYMRWTFEVTEPGTYKVASYHRVKKDTNTRNAYIQFDNEEKFLLEATISESRVNQVNDGLAGAYLIWGNFEIELSAGKHTITCTADENVNLYIHWRAIYLCKVTPAAS
jgi:hypothetical protein